MVVIFEWMDELSLDHLLVSQWDICENHSMLYDIVNSQKKMKRLWITNISDHITIFDIRLPKIPTLCRPRVSIGQLLWPTRASVRLSLDLKINLSREFRWLKWSLFVLSHIYPSVDIARRQRSPIDNQNRVRTLPLLASVFKIPHLPSPSNQN